MTEFLGLPLPLQAIIAIALLFITFIIVMEAKWFSARLIKKGGTYKILGYVILAVVGIPFAVADAGVNIIYAPVIFRELANHHNEGWLLTSRLQWHTAQPGLYWQKRVAIYLCEHIENVDPGHCQTKRFNK